jgi:hypothetical protein
MTKSWIGREVANNDPDPSFDVSALRVSFKAQLQGEAPAIFDTDPGLVMLARYCAGASEFPRASSVIKQLQIDDTEFPTYTNAMDSALRIVGVSNEQILGSNYRE